MQILHNFAKFSNFAKKIANPATFCKMLQISQIVADFAIFAKFGKFLVKFAGEVAKMTKCFVGFSKIIKKFQKERAPPTPITARCVMWYTKSTNSQKVAGFANLHIFQANTMNHTVSRAPSPRFVCLCFVCMCVCMYVCMWVTKRGLKVAWGAPPRQGVTS